jgi:enamine deaminase RidA (YjgF/YER057c/UK114 family)
MRRVAHVRWSRRVCNSVAPADLAGQARKVYANLGRALAAAGGHPD